MNNIEKKLKEAAKDRYSLSSNERARIEDRVQEHMKYKPIRRETKVVSYAFSSFYIAMRRTGAIVAVFAIVFVMGGLTTAANNALPGDVLYPVKHILEDARSAVSLSAESKAEWEVHRLERRIDEAAILEGMGELDQEKQDKIDGYVAEHAERADQLVGKIGDGDLIAATNLRAHVAIELESKAGGEQSMASMDTFAVQDDAMEARTMVAPEIESLEEDVEDTKQSKYRATASKQRESARELMARVERQKDIAKINSNNSEFEENILTPLASLRADMKKAEEFYEAGSYKEALDHFMEVHRKARALDLKLKRGSWMESVGVEIGEVIVDEIVPDDLPGVDHPESIEAEIENSPDVIPSIGE